MIWLIILIVILLGGIGYAAYRIWYLAGVLADAQEYIEELEVTNRYMYSKILESYDTMQRIDQKQAFEKEIALNAESSADIIALLDTQCYFDLLKIAYPSTREAVIEKFASEKFIKKTIINQ